MYHVKVDNRLHHRLEVGLYRLSVSVQIFKVLVSEETYNWIQCELSL